MRGVHWIVGFVLVAGCLSGPDERPREPAPAAPPAMPVTLEPAEPGLFTADADGRLSPAPSLEGWMPLPEGGWHVDVAQVLEPDHLTFYLVQALAPQEANAHLLADIVVDPEGPRLGE